MEQPFKPVKIDTTAMRETTVGGPKHVEVAGLNQSLNFLDLEEARRELIFAGGHKTVLNNIRALAAQPMRNNGWARLFCELMGWVGTREQVIQALVVNLGVSLEQAKVAVEAVASAPKDPHEIAEQCRQYLKWYHGVSGPGGPDKNFSNVEVVG